MRLTLGQLLPTLKLLMVFGIFAWFIALGRLDSRLSAFYAPEYALYTSGFLIILLTALIATKYKSFLRILQRNWALTALTLWAMLSVFWSLEPWVAIEEAIKLLATMLFASYLFLRLSPEHRYITLGWAMLLIAVLSFATAIFIPTIGIVYEGSHAGDWRGIFFSKNSFGQTLVFAVLLLGYVALTHHRRLKRWLAWSGVLLCCVLIALSNSRSAWILLVSVPIFAGFFNFLRRAPRLRLPVVLLTLYAVPVASALILSNLHEVTQALGRDVTLTGRVPLWDVMLVEIQQHTWLGVGFRSFWLGPGGPSTEIINALWWDVVHGHNGWLDTWLELGLVGLALQAVHTLAMFGLAWGRLRQYKSNDGVLLLTFLSLFFLLNLTENFFLRPLSPIWILYVFTSIQLVMSGQAMISERPIRQRKLVLSR